MGTREEFEKSEHLKERLAICWYDEKIGCYLSIQLCDYAAASYLNGAWYAFQEQQKKIDICEKLRDSQFDKLWNLTQAIEVARNGADEDFDLFLNHLSNILKGE